MGICGNEHGLFVCTLESGHDGNHLAERGANGAFAEWPQKSPTVEQRLDRIEAIVDSLHKTFERIGKRLDGLENIVKEIVGADENSPRLGDVDLKGAIDEIGSGGRGRKPAKSAGVEKSHTLGRQNLPAKSAGPAKIAGSS